MDRVKSLASEYPLIFGITITFIFLLMLVVSAVLGNLWPGEVTYGQLGGIVGRLISITILLMLLSSLGWLRAAGFTSLGRWRTWLMILLPLAYSISVLAFAMARKIDIGNFNLAMPGLVALFILIAASLEEAAFRGVVLHGFIRVWQHKPRCHQERPGFLTLI